MRSDLGRIGVALMLLAGSVLLSLLAGGLSPAEAAACASDSALESVPRC